MKPSYSAKAGCPVRRNFSVRLLTPWNTGSPAFAGDDGRRCDTSVFIKRILTFSRRCTPELCMNLSPDKGRGRYPKGGAGNAGCPLHPQPRVVSSKHAR
jgi:hypothetical protein